MTDKQDRLATYLIGTMTAPERVAFERDLAHDPALRAALAEHTSVAEKLADAASPVTPSPSLRERLLTSVNGRQPYAGFVERVSQFLDLGSANVRAIFARATDPTQWEASPFEATRFLHFDGGPRVAEADCGLVEIAPGTRFPHHSHDGDEWAFVLQGRIREDDGSTFGPGDITHRPAGSQHSIEALGDVPLVFVVVLHDGLTVTAAP